MTTEPYQALTDAITDLLTFAWHYRDHLEDPSPELAEQFAGQLHSVNKRAKDAGRANNYLHLVNNEEHPNPEEDSWGRRLTNRHLITLGITDLLRDLSEPAVPADVIAGLAAYLAGPPVACERMFVIDADLPLSSPVDIAGWRLARLEPADLIFAYTAAVDAPVCRRPMGRGPEPWRVRGASPC